MKKEKRNIHFIPSLGYGGAESFLLRLIPHLENQNIVITLYQTKYDKKRIAGKELLYITLDPLRTSIKDIYSFIKIIFTLNENDILFSWLYISDLIGSLIKVIFFWKNFKLIWNVRNTILPKNEYSYFAFISFNILRTILKFLPDKIIFNSFRSKKQHLDKGYLKKKSLVISNGYEYLSSIKTPKNNIKIFNIIYVARYHRQKNYNLLLSSIHEFKNISNKKFKLHLVGKEINSGNKKLIKRLIELNIHENTILHGLITPEEVHELFSKCDISLLLSNYGEAFPNVLAESMLYGTLPISTDVGDAKKIIGKHGKIVPIFSDPQDIAFLIEDYANIKNENFAKWKNMINDCYEFSKKRFMITKIASKFNSISKKL